MKPTYGDLELLLNSAESYWTEAREEVVRLRAALDLAIGERDTARQERDTAVARAEGRLR